MRGPAKHKYLGPPSRIEKNPLTHIRTYHHRRESCAIYSPDSCCVPRTGRNVIHVGYYVRGPAKQNYLGSQSNRKKHLTYIQTDHYRRESRVTLYLSRVIHQTAAVSPDREKSVLYYSDTMCEDPQSTTPWVPSRIEEKQILSYNIKTCNYEIGRQLLLLLRSQGFYLRFLKWVSEIKSVVLIRSSLEPHSFSASVAHWGQCCL